MLNLFIDTNVFLNFYSFTNEHLNKLEKLVNLIKDKKVKLFLTGQVVDEFNRKRENKLKETLEYIDSLTPNVNIPITHHGIEKLKEIQEHIEKLKSLSDELYKNFKKQIKDRSLPADKLINEIFSINDILNVDEYIFNKAKIRFEKGNPPGKEPYGDAINWEILISKVNDGEDLFFISGDNHFSSILDENEFSPFLKNEWITKRRSNIFYYRLISQFIKDKFPEVNITKTEIKKEKYLSGMRLVVPKDFIERFGSLGVIGGTDRVFKPLAENIKIIERPYKELEKIRIPIDEVLKPIKDLNERFNRSNEYIKEILGNQNKIRKMLERK